MPAERRQSYKQIDEIARTIRELKVSVGCLHRSFTEFSDTYEPYLKDALELDKLWKRRKESVIIGTAKYTIWSIICGFAVAVWYSMKAYLGLKT